jgi:hypothetical protein
MKYSKGLEIMTGVGEPLPSTEEIIRKALDAVAVAEAKARDCHPSMQSQAWAYVSEAWAAVGRLMVDYISVRSTVVAVDYGIPDSVVDAEPIPADATAVIPRQRDNQRWKSFVVPAYEDLPEALKIYQAYIVDAIHRSPNKEVEVPFYLTPDPQPKAKSPLTVTADPANNRYVIRLG